MSNMFDGQVALVTGASQGIGLASAKAFAEAGAAVVLADIDEKAADAAAEQLERTGHQVRALRCDVADENDVANMVAETVGAFGRIDAALQQYRHQSPAIDLKLKILSPSPRAVSLSRLARVRSPTGRKL